MSKAIVARPTGNGGAPGRSRTSGSTSSAANSRRAADIPSANTVCRFASCRRDCDAMPSAPMKAMNEPGVMWPCIERQPT